MITSRAYIQEEHIDYKKAKEDYKAIQANPDLVEKGMFECDCLIHRKRKNAKQADHSPWVGNNWFAWEHGDSTYSARYLSTSTMAENVITLKEKKWEKK